MTIYQRLFQPLVLLCFAVFLTSCGVKEYILPSTAYYAMDITAAPELNPNKDGRPSPLVIRLYELKSLDEFNNGDFFAIYDNEAKTIGKTMLSKEEIEMKPGEKRHIDRTANPQARYLGVIAAYRDLDNAQWRAVVALPQKSHSKFNLYLGSLALSLTPR